MEASQEPEDPASRGRLWLPPIHGGVVHPQAEPVAAAEGGHLLAEEEEQCVEAERGVHGPHVAQVQGGLHLQHTEERWGRERAQGRGERGKAGEPPKTCTVGRWESCRPHRSSLIPPTWSTTSPQAPPSLRAPSSTEHQRAGRSLQKDRLWPCLALE